MSAKINIEGREIAVKIVNEQDYISLTDMAKWDNNPISNQRIPNWLRLQNTIEFMGLWEISHNPDFNYIEFDIIKNEVKGNAYLLSVKQWIEKTNAIGIVSKAGRYGGTFAHRIIAFEFASWLSAKFKYYLVIEFERLKSVEFQRAKLEWDAGRFLSKINYSLQTEAIETRLIPKLQGKEKGLAYASEADLINLALFGQTSKQWRESNADAKGNIRDGASIKELIVLSNLETHNSYLIMAGASKEARFMRLCEIAESQLEIFGRDKRLNDDKKFLE